MSAPIGFTLTPFGQLVVTAWHAQLTASGGYVGKDQYINNGVAQTPVRLVATVYEWQFPKIEVAATQTQISGSRTYEVRAQLGPLQPDDAVAMVSCTWSFGQGTAAPLPPSATSSQGPPTSAGATSGAAGSGGVPAGGAAAGGATGGGVPAGGAAAGGATGGGMPAGGAAAGGATGGGVAGGGSAAGGASGGGTSSGAAPALLSVSPNSLEQGVTLSGVIALTGQATAWQPGSTTVDFGPGIRVQSGPIVQSPTTLAVYVSVDWTAPPGPRAVTVSAGSQVSTLPNALNIVARAQPAITQISPTSLSAGQRNVSVVFTGQGTRWRQGATSVSFLGAGIQMLGITVNSTTQMTVVISVDPAAAPGPRDVLVLNPGPVVGSDILNMPGAVNIIASPSPLSTATVVPFVPAIAGTTLTGTGTPPTQAAATAPLAPAVTTVAGGTAGSAPSSGGASGVYLVTITGVICGQPTADTTMTGLINVGDPDGRGDEIQAGAYVRRFDRATQQLLESGNRRTLPYGDITAATGRLQAGTQTPSGGIRAGDWIPANLSVARVFAAQDQSFPWRAWEGRLSDGEVLLVSPAVWEYDGREDYYAKWLEAQRLLDQTILTDPGVQNRILNQSLAPVEAGAVPYYPVGGDQPIGRRPGGQWPFFPNITIVLTREIIDRALTATSWATTQVPVTGQPLTLPKPGMLLLNFTESGSSPTSYSLILQVEKVGP